MPKRRRDWLDAGHTSTEAHGLAWPDRLDSSPTAGSTLSDWTVPTAVGVCEPVLAEESHSFPGLPERPKTSVDSLLFGADFRLEMRGLSVASELDRMPEPSSTTEMMAMLATLSVDLLDCPVVKVGRHT